MGLQTGVAWHSRRAFSITIFILITVLIFSVSLPPGNWFPTFPFLSLAYSTFYIVGLILSMQVPFVGFQPIRTSEHMAAAGESLSLFEHQLLQLSENLNMNALPEALNSAFLGSKFPFFLNKSPRFFKSLDSTLWFPSWRFSSAFPLFRIRHQQVKPIVAVVHNNVFSSQTEWHSPPGVEGVNI